MDRRVLQRFLSGNLENSLEKEVSVGIEHDTKQAAVHGGLMIPWRISASGLDSKSGSGGGYLVQENVSRNIIDSLQAQTKVLSLGAQFISGIRYTLEVPVEDEIVSAQWMNENPADDAEQSDPTFAFRILRPHGVIGTVQASRQLLQQASPDMEQWLRNRLARAHALLLDRACIHGSGLENEPIGILATPGVGSVAIGANGGAVAASHLVELESAVADANGGVDSLAFLSNSKQRAKLRAVPELAAGVLPVWRDDRLLGYPASVSNQVSSSLVKGESGEVCSAIVFGNWSSLVIGEFSGALEITVDPYAQKRRGIVELSSYAAYDCGIMQPASFAAIVDAI